MSVDIIMEVKMVVVNDVLPFIMSVQVVFLLTPEMYRGTWFM